MKRRNRFVLLAAAGAATVAGGAMAGCFQRFDPDLSSGAAAVASGVDGGSSTCPPGEVCSDPGTTQCTLDSPECFYLCGSPLCALGNDPDEPDGGAVLPSAQTDPPIYLGSTDDQMVADGSTSTDPCAQIEAESLLIRERSCSGCHTSAAGTSNAACGCALTYILDDSTLTTSRSPDFTTDSGAPAPYLVPGNPGASLIYERILAGQMPPSASLAFQILGPEAGAALVYPTPSDLSVLYGWILNCVAGTDGGAYSSSAYGGSLAGTPCFGPCGDGGAGSED